MTALSSRTLPLLAEIRDENGWASPGEEPLEFCERVKATLEYIADSPADAGTPRERRFAVKVLTRFLRVYDASGVQKRLEYLREEIRNERISYVELAELQGLAEYIDPSDMELLEWAGVPE